MKWPAAFGEIDELIAVATGAAIARAAVKPAWKRECGWCLGTGRALSKLFRRLLILVKGSRSARMGRVLNVFKTSVHRQVTTNETTPHLLERRNQRPQRL